MDSDRIDFISAYCDGWCVRCAFTERCSAFAARVAIAMCGDVDEGLELAVGVPRPEGGREASAPTRWDDDGEGVEDSADDLALGRAEERRERDMREVPIMTLAHACSLVGSRWLFERGTRGASTDDAALVEALEVAAHDASLVSAKLYRALLGRLRHREDGCVEDHPVQNDWNGSAKVALLSLERSELAWRVIAQASGEETPAALADQLRTLRREVEDAFPDAWSFVRPGFDEPG
jgi:hypothetical protein